MPRKRAWKLLLIPAAVAACAGGADAPEQQAASVADEVRPLQLRQAVESVYDLEAPPAEEGYNAGGVTFDLTVRYMTDYVFRGIDRSEGSGNFNDEKGNPVIFDPDPDFKPG